jgi:two-component system chemotaxis response regulator CheB
VSGGERIGLPVRVLVADDSAFSRVTIARLVEADRRFRVVAAAHSGEEAIRLVVSLRPDLLTLDLEMPGMDGFSVLRWLAANHPVPTVVVSSRQGREDVFRALDLGAVEFVVKPQARASAEYGRMEAELLEKLRAASMARAVSPPSPAAGPRATAPPGQAGGLLVVGASTGGPTAISRLLGGLPRLPGPIAIAQHMPAGFTRLFADRLSRTSAFPVVEAADGQRIEAGTAYVAPGGEHLELSGRFPELAARVRPRKADDLYAPSVDRLFRSAAECAGARAVAVILTGMGTDGRDGMEAVVRAGGRTIAEDESTAVVFGMPAEAARHGAAEFVLPLPEIAAAVVRLQGERRAGPGA